MLFLSIAKSKSKRNITNIFLRGTLRWLDNMYNRMDRVVSLYMDNVEDMHDIENSIICDQPSS